MQSYLLVALFLPFCDQMCIGVVILEKPFIKLLRYSFFLVIELVYVSGTWWLQGTNVSFGDPLIDIEVGQHTLMAYLEDRPKYLMPLFSFMRSVLGIFHFVAELEESVL